MYSNQTHPSKDLLTSIYGISERVGFLIGNGGAGALGIIKELALDFIERYKKNYSIGYVKRGSGENIELIKEGRLDIALTYEPHLELELLNNNIICDYRCIFMDYFLIAGPIKDPINLSSITNNTEDIYQILDYIKNKHGKFLTRQGTSATTIKEQTIFKSLGYNTDILADWYIRTENLFPSEALSESSKQNCYILNDLSTWRSLPEIHNNMKIYSGGGASHNINIENDENWKKQYENPCSSIVYINNGIYNKEALEFAEYLTTENAQNIINNVGIKEHGIAYVKSNPIIYHAFKK